MNRSPEELDCAIAGGSWDAQSKTCTIGVLQTLPTIPVVPGPSTSNTGTIDPQQMFDDGFVYINGKWVRSMGAAADALAASAGRPPGMSSVLPVQSIQGGSVLGTQVPVAPAVLLPSFVGGRVGTVTFGKGMRPQSGGGERVRFGQSSGLPEVRM